MWVDLYVRPEDEAELEEMLSLHRRMGYKIVGVDKGFLQTRGEVALIASRELGVKIIPVEVLEPRNVGEARAALRRVRRGELTLGRPRNPQLFRLFSRDSRVRVLEVCPKLSWGIDAPGAELMRRGSTVIGVDLSLLLERVERLAWLSELIARATKHAVPLTVYSGARTWDMLWHPAHVRALVESLGFPGSLAASALRPAFIELTELRA
ncbi:MAG: hypothetical protein QXU97_00575 [Fervidicoccaceae archaeon]